MSRARLVGVGAVLLVLMCVSAASAGEVSRTEYKSVVEPICLRNVKANERIFAGVRREVNRGKLKPAAHQFAKAANALRKTVAELRVVPRPSADRAILSHWLTRVGKLAVSFGVIAKKLRAGEKWKVTHLVVRLTAAAEAANRLVFEFEFEHCRLEPSQFT